MVPLFADIALGAACVWAEARSEPMSGQIAVAEVIRNRMERRYQSDGTVAGTVLRPFQFSCFGDTTPWRPTIFQLHWGDRSVEVARQAWLIALTDTGAERSDLAKGAVLYHTIKAPGSTAKWPPKWAKAPGVVEVARIGAHVFYDDRSGGTP